MPDVEITVAGEARASVSPDLGTLHGQVLVDGDDLQDVVRRVTASVGALAETLRTLAGAPGTALASWSVDDAVSGVRQEWSPEGRARTVRYAAASVRAAFTDAGALGAWVAAASSVAGFAVGGVGWSLLPEHEEEVRDGLRRDAVADATRRARAYATAAGLAAPRWVALADEGMLRGGSEIGFEAMAGVGAPRQAPRWRRIAAVPARATRADGGRARAVRRRHRSPRTVPAPGGVLTCASA